MSVVTNLIGGIFNVGAASKKKAAVKKAARIQQAAIAEERAHQIADIKREVTRTSGRQALAYSAAGVELTSATPQTMITYTKERGEEEIAHVNRMADLNSLMTRLQSQNAQKEITFQSWMSMLGSTSASVSSFLGSYKGAGMGGEKSFGQSLLGNVW